jgi:hypothetical protein
VPRCCLRICNACCGSSETGLVGFGVVGSSVRQTGLLLTLVGSNRGRAPAFRMTPMGQLRRSRTRPVSSAVPEQADIDGCIKDSDRHPRSTGPTVSKVLQPALNFKGDSGFAIYTTETFALPAVECTEGEVIQVLARIAP